MSKYKIILPSEQRVLLVEEGTTLLAALTGAGCAPEAPCGGNGTCGKCKVLVDGAEVFSCRTVVDRDMRVLLPPKVQTEIMARGIDPEKRLTPGKEGYLLAVDIGTTTVVCYLLDGATGEELAHASGLNPQAPFGADVISRIRAALNGSMEALTDCIRQCLDSLIREVCNRARVEPGEISLVSVVGNPAMQQLFLGISPENLARIPFAPVLTEAGRIPAKDCLPLCKQAELLIIPDISGYVGADTLACVLAAGQDEREEITLLVDIGTNGEMVLGSREGLVACSTAAGPALEGANIRFGMRGAPGAIDHVWLENGEIRHSVIGGGEARGICGSGLIDAVAVLLEAGRINRRGRILSGADADGQPAVFLTPGIYLTQEDIREVQLAKGAIAAGIELMAREVGVGLEQIERVLLAGAFGSFMDPESACRIGLLPEALRGKITAIGNAAGSGAKLLALEDVRLEQAQALKDRIRFLELAQLPEFRRVFAKNMSFREEGS